MTHHEEMAIFPGMEELSALLYVNQWQKEKRYDVIILDCAPTGESLRFVSMPTTMKWYMQHVFPVQRGLLKAVRPIANRVAPFELPPDSYFAAVKDLFDQIEGIDQALETRASPAYGSLRTRRKWWFAKRSGRLSIFRCTA